jgi:hypothetical protein
MQTPRIHVAWHPLPCMIVSPTPLLRQRLLGRIRSFRDGRKRRYLVQFPRSIHGEGRHRDEPPRVASRDVTLLPTQATPLLRQHSVEVSTV